MSGLPASWSILARCLICAASGLTVFFALVCFTNVARILGTNDDGLKVEAVRGFSKFFFAAGLADFIAFACYRRDYVRPAIVLSLVVILFLWLVGYKPIVGGVLALALIAFLAMRLRQARA